MVCREKCRLALQGSLHCVRLTEPNINYIDVCFQLFFAILDTYLDYKNDHWSSNQSKFFDKVLEKFACLQN